VHRYLRETKPHFDLAPEVTSKDPTLAYFWLKLHRRFRLVQDAARFHSIHGRGGFTFNLKILKSQFEGNISVPDNEVQSPTPQLIDANSL
jgi:hypothetical protein